LVDLRIREVSYQFNFNFIKKYFNSRSEISTAGKNRKKIGTFAFDVWQNLKIGDIIIVKDGQEFPADVLILDSELINYSEKKKDLITATVGKVTKNEFVQTMKDKILVNYGSNRQFKLR